MIRRLRETGHDIKIALQIWSILRLVRIHRHFAIRSIVATTLRLLCVSDSVSPRPSGSAIRQLLESTSTWTSSSLLSVRVHDAPDHIRMTAMLSLVGKGEWSSRASRCVMEWWKSDPVQASSSIAVWSADTERLSPEQQRLVFRAMSAVGELFEPAAATYLFFEIVPFALRRVDPYTESSAAAAQEAAANLLAVNPDIALRWADIPLAGIERQNRRLILISAMSSHRKLSVFENFGQLSHLLGTNYSHIRSALRQVDDKYSAGGPVRIQPRSKKSAYQLWFPVSIVIGVLLSLLTILGSLHLPYQFKGKSLSGWDGVILPLFAVVTAVHLLAIDLAASRFPRQVVIATASSPVVLVAYGFFFGEILYTDIGSSIYPIPASREAELALLTVLGIALLLALIVVELIRFQDPLRVANMLWNRAYRPATKAAPILSEAIEANERWEEVKDSLRNVKKRRSPQLPDEHTL